MIEGIAIEELERRIRIDHPAWADAGVHHEAARLLKALDPKAEEPLKTYVRTGRRIDFLGNGISALQLQSLTDCDYIEAVEIASLALGGRMRALEALAQRTHLANRLRVVFASPYVAQAKAFSSAIA